jgi:hypothetical protein
MKKREFIFIISILSSMMILLGGIQAGIAHQQKHTDSVPQTQTLSFTFSPPIFSENDQSLSIQLNEATGYRNTPGEPMLPLYIKTFEYPFGTQITDIQCINTETNDLQLTQKIAPAATPIVASGQIPQQPTNDKIYSTDQLFPTSWFSYRLTGGLNKENLLTTFLTIQINPVRYNPVTNSIQSLSAITLDITAQKPVHPFAPLSDAYDMIIICYDKYAPLLQPLVAHKNSHGIRTLLVPLKDITDGKYFPAQGRDTQEQIKYFMKNAKETWNITYVMLVGNYAQVPARLSQLETDVGQIYEELTFCSDLYYADLYTANGSFSSWDTDNDGLYAEWPYPESSPQEDIVDLAADVYVSRLACMSSAEVTTLVDKIITYENTTAGADWFTRMVVSGGDTYEKSIEGGTDYNEGEVVTAAALDIMSQFTPIKIWTSLGNLTTKNLHDQIGAGCGFLFLAGHGSPNMWATHNNGDYANWTEGLRNMDILKLTNVDTYPVLIVGGCHNSEINVRMLNILKGVLKEGLHYFSGNPENFGSFWLYNWVPECWSWVFVKAKGGAISSLGSCGYGCDSVGDYDGNGIPDCTEYYDGWLELQFFRLYNQQNMTILGQNYYQDVNEYIQTFPVDTNRYDAKVIETHILLGDPSLKIGGYE